MALIACGGSEHRVSLVQGQFPPLARGERPEGKVPDPSAHQPQGGVTDGGSHAANLPIASLHQLQRNPSIRNGFAHADRRHPWSQNGSGIQSPRSAGKRAAAFDHDTTGKSLEISLVGQTLDLDPVLTPMSLRRIQQPVVKAGLIAQQQQSLGVRIEPPQRIDPGGQAEIRERAPARTGLWGELGKHPVGLVQGDQHPDR